MNGAVLVDVNGDGKLDLLAASGPANSIDCYLGVGNGAFTYFGSTGVGSNSVNIAAGDWNKDGKIDIAVVNFSAGTVSVLLNNGPGTFSLNQTVTVGTNPVSIIASDLNNDGSLDLAVANQASNSVSILLNNKSGIFNVTNTLSGMSFTDIAEGSQYLCASDFDGDGSVDLAVISVGGNAVRILKGNGNGGFILANSVNVGTSPHGVFFADFNLDGKTDMLASNYGGANTSVMLNQTPTSMVSSVGIDLPNIFSVSNSPVTGSGTIAVSLTSQSPNTLFAGPDGINGLPTFRKLTTSDIPILSDQINQCNIFKSEGNQPANCASVSHLANTDTVSRQKLECGTAVCSPGLYVITYYLRTTKAADSGTLKFDCEWEDGVQESQSSSPLALTSSDSGSYISGQCILRSDGNTDISYSTSVENVSGNFAYDTFISVQRIQ
jgi:hypothetical protein